MEPLSPRSNNIQIRQQAAAKPERLEEKAAAARRLQREKDHPPPPPPFIQEPDTPSGEPGSRYATGKFLGKGGFAICYEGELQDAQSRPSGHRFALKIVKSVMQQSKMTEKFKTELQIHSKMHHPHIVDFHRAFTFADSTFVVLGLCENGSMMDMVRKRKYLTEPEVRRYLIQTCGAIKYMHHKNVIHRDLKMGNIFLDRDMNVKIGDFGLAALLVSDKEYSANRRRTLCGTPNYIAPEVLEKGQKGHDYKVDIWSLGIIIFAMLTGFPPFQSKTQEEIYRKVKARDYLWPTADKCANDISGHAQDLVASLLVQAEDRPEPDEIVSHAFFRQGVVLGNIPASARHTQPTWEGWHPGLGVTETAWWNAQWRHVCVRCGVGKMTQKQNFPLVGEELDKTTYQECRLEEKAGRTPVVPIPAKLVYRPFPDDKNWPVPDTHAEYDLLQLARPITAQTVRLGKVGASGIHVPSARQAKTLPRNTKLSTVTEPEDGSGLTTELPRPDAKSHAAKLREQVQPLRPLAPKPMQKREVVVPPAPVESPPNPKSGRLLEGAVRRANSSRSVSNPVATARITRSQSVQTNLYQGSQATTATTRGGIGKSASSRSVTREAQPAIKEEEPRPDLKINARANAVGNDMLARQVAELGDVMKELRLDVGKGANHQRPDTQRPKSTMSHTALDLSVPRPALIAPTECGEQVGRTTPSAVHQQLWTSLQNLDAALNLPPGRVMEIERRQKPYPIVIKWVDYTNKFGIGYILSDGSIGCLFNAEGEVPSTCVVVRDGESHVKKRDLQSYASRHQIVPVDGPPIEFFENCGNDGLKYVTADARRYQVIVGDEGTTEKLPPGKDEYDNRKRKTVVLWRKFANYMTESLGQTESDGRKESKTGGTTGGCGPFVRFYQRFADVGVWGFGHGGFQVSMSERGARSETDQTQFNFPDHTKLVLSEDALHCDFYHLPASAASQLQLTQSLPSTSLEKRSVLSYPVHSLLSGSYHAPGSTGAGTSSRSKGLSSSVVDFSAIVTANQFEAKMRFVRSVLHQWYTNGGLGRMNADNQRLEWRGMREVKRRSKAGQAGAVPPSSKMEKLVWVTVGAAGGDSRISELR
ncbi:MAG: Cell cycle serine/threonine-protein kinase cdc5/MSD2 [Thelocarpon superellum]|nr:MAG: Cell cycle serine/threonine-protein kinase cdc5/MSD2 [Thelocarpon superellum]